MTKGDVHDHDEGKKGFLAGFVSLCLYLGLCGFRRVWLRSLAFLSIVVFPLFSFVISFICMCFLNGGRMPHTLCGGKNYLGAVESLSLCVSIVSVPNAERGTGCR